MIDNITGALIGAISAIGTVGIIVVLFFQLVTISKSLFELLFKTDKHSKTPDVMSKAMTDMMTGIMISILIHNILSTIKNGKEKKFDAPEIYKKATTLLPSELQKYGSEMEDFLKDGLDERKRSSSLRRLFKIKESYSLAFLIGKTFILGFKFKRSVTHK